MKKKLKRDKKNKNIYLRVDDANQVLKKIVEVQKETVNVQAESFKALAEATFKISKSYSQLLKFTFFLLLFLILYLRYTDTILSLISAPFLYLWDLYNKSTVDTRLLIVTNFITGIIVYFGSTFINKKRN